MKNLGNVESIVVQNKIIILLDAKWNKFFKSEPVFEAVIDKDGRLALHGPKLNLVPHRDHPTAKQEETT